MRQESGGIPPHIHKERQKSASKHHRNEHPDGPIGAIALRFTSFMEDYRGYFRVVRHERPVSL